MEDTLWDHERDYHMASLRQVLILILMEDTLWDLKTI